MFFLYGIHIDNLEKEPLALLLEQWLISQKGHTIFTPNPEFLLEARASKSFLDLLNASDLSLPDGIGLTFAAAALTDQRLLHRQTGIDTLLLLARLCKKNHKRLLLLGGVEDVAFEAARRLNDQFPGLHSTAINPGYLAGDDRSVDIPTTLLDDMQALQPDVIAVALGQGKQERVCLDLVECFPCVRITIGVGGALDTLSGQRARAPTWMRNHGLEWVWRLMIEPKRWKRIVRATIVFPLVVLSDTIKQHRFLNACRNVLKAFFTV